MRKINFTKMVATGNDFVLVAEKLSGNLSTLAKNICDRKLGIGADGLLLLEKSKNADIRMRILNADGSEAQMCGNGAMCVAFYSGTQLPNPNFQLKIETKAGIIDPRVESSSVAIRLTEPHSIKLDLPIKIGRRKVHVNSINTGVPHIVIFVNGLDGIAVRELGRDMRYHKAFAPRGTNVNFVEVVNKDTIRLRTYERGVEDETLACGTGSVASALVFALKNKNRIEKVNVATKSKEILKVYFKRVGDNFKNVWLEGGAKIVYRGVYYV